MPARLKWAHHERAVSGDGSYEIRNHGDIDLTAYRYMSTAFRQVMADAAGNGGLALSRPVSVRRP